MITLAISACLAACSMGMDEPPPLPPGLLVVAPEAMRESLGAFVEHKRAIMRVEQVTLEGAIRGRDGADDAEKLKHYLYDAWKDRGVRYVLLVGDADVMPVRFMVLDRVTTEAFDYAFYPCDLYYADVAKSDGTFDDWNGRKDGFHAGYFGEVRGEKNKSDEMNFDGISYVPELALGRWPVSTPEQAAAVASKTIAYDVAMDRGEIKAVAAGIAVGGWVDARGQMDAMGAKLGKGGKGWVFEKRYYQDGEKAKGKDTGSELPVPPELLPDEKNVVGLLNSGASLVIHAGHGSDDSWAGCFSVGSIRKLTEQKHPAVMISAGCSTARFCTLPPYEGYVDVDGVEHKGTNAGEVFQGPPRPPSCYAKGKYNLTGLGEALVRDAGVERGAICYIGCNTGSQPCALTLEEGFVEEVGSGKGEVGSKAGRGVRVGDCWRKAVGLYYEREHLATLKPNADWYPASIFFQGMKYMMYGDPTVEVGGGERRESKGGD